MHVAHARSLHAPGHPAFQHTILNSENLGQSQEHSVCLFNTNIAYAQLEKPLLLCLSHSSA